MTKPQHSACVRFAAASTALLFAVQSKVFAAARTWTGATSNDASVAGNWNALPVSGTDSLVFATTTDPLRRSPTFNTDFTAKGGNTLDFNSATSDFTLGGTGVLTLDTAGATATTIIRHLSSTVNSQTIKNNVILTNSVSASAAVNINLGATANSLTFGGNVTSLAGELKLNGSNASSAITFASLTSANAFTITTPSTATITNASGLTGTTTINGANVRLGSSLGSGGIIALTGASDTVLRLANGMTLNNAIQSGSVLTNKTSLQVDSGTATITGLISGSRPLEKTGVGTLVLSGVNHTYSGELTITQGRFQIDSGKFNNAIAVNLGAATLSALNAQTFGTLDVTGSAIIDFTSSTTSFAFADSSAVNWSGGILSISGGFFTNGSSLRFGTSSTGLTSAQLALIRMTGFDTFNLDSSGYLVATSSVPEPATYSAVAGLAILGFATSRRRRRAVVGQ